MKAASVNEIKKELEVRSKADLLTFCMRLIKHKKENKELLTFLLFHAHDTTSYIHEIKEVTTQLFEEMNTHHIFYIKKSIRKILRFVNKQAKFAVSKQLEAEMRIHFCNCILAYAVPLKKSVQLSQLYQKQMKKIDTLLSSVHPDLQFDLKRQLLK